MGGSRVFQTGSFVASSKFIHTFRPYTIGRFIAWRLSVDPERVSIPHKGGGLAPETVLDEPFRS